MSMRGTMTSRTIVSPNSITEWMKLRSEDSIALSSWATSAMASTSDSVIFWVWPSRPNDADHALRDAEQQRREPLDGPELEQRAHDRRREQGRVVGVLDRVVLRYRLEEDEDHHDLADDANEQSRGTEQSVREYADHRRRDQLADQDQQQERVEELLRRLGEQRQRSRAATVLFLQRTRSRLVHANQRGLGEGEESRQHEQHQHGEREVGVARSPGGGDHVAAR